MTNKPNHVMTKYNDEALGTEMVEETSALDVTSSLTQTINRNKELLNKGLKASEDELKQLANIQNNINLANQKKQELINMHYINDITYQNHIIASHNSSIQYAMQRGIQFWKSYDGSSIFYRVNAFTKKKKLNVEKDAYSLLGTHIKIYDSIGEVQFSNENTLILIASYLSIVKDEIFDPLANAEWVMYNNMKYKNTFQYTSLLERRNMLIEKIRLEQQLQLQSQYYPSPQFIPQSINIAPLAQQQTIQLLQPFESTQNEFILSLLSPQDKLQELSQKLEMRLSIIIDFIFQLSKDEYQYNYIMNWLASFVQNLNKSARAIVLIGDRNTTNILSQKIIQPIFAFRQEYFSVINNDALKKDDNIILKNKIFYHIDADDIESDKTQRVSELIRTIIKPDTIDFITAMDKDETYIYGETIVTSSNKSAYPFLKNSYSRCSVFSVKHIDTILQKFNVDPLELDELIENDLENFSNILAQYQTDRQYFTIAQTDEKNALPKMKKGILLTPMLESYIQQFIVAIKDKVKEYFKPLELEDDKNLYKELVENFDNDDAIYQPLLSEYFNIIHKDIIFPDNSGFIDILKERECLFNQAADDKFKLNGQRRYKIHEYQLAKNYKGNCTDTI